MVGPKTFLSELSIISGLFSNVIDDPGDGLPKAINLGIASFPPVVKYVGWLGDDDLLSPNSLINSLKILEECPGVVATYGACIYIDQNGHELFINKSGKWASKFINFLPNLIPQPGSIFRRSAYESVGGVKSTFPLSFDFELFLNLKKLGTLHYIPEVQSLFRWHEDSLSVNQRKSAVLQTSKIRMLSLPKPLKIIAPVWEGLIIVGTLIIGIIIKMKLKTNP